MAAVGIGGSLARVSLLVFVVLSLSLSLLKSPPRGCRYPFGSEQLDGSRWDSVTEWIVGVVPYVDIDGEFNELF